MPHPFLRSPKQGEFYATHSRRIATQSRSSKKTILLYSFIELLITAVVWLWICFIMNYMDFVLYLCNIDYMDVD